jgi:type II secretory pathway pseudopilin PulG
MVELLVVAAILVVLLGILLPVVSSVRESSKTAVCANNMKEIARAVQVFATDNDGRGPGSGHHNTGSVSWANILDNEVFERDGASYAIVRSSAKGNPQTLSCPNFEGGSSRRGYGLSGALTGGTQHPDDPSRHTAGYSPNGKPYPYSASSAGVKPTYYLGEKLINFTPTSILLGEKHSGSDTVGGDNRTIVFNRDAPPDAPANGRTEDSNGVPISPPLPGYADWKLDLSGGTQKSRVGDFVFRHPFYGKTLVAKFDHSVEVLGPQEVTQASRY